ncbi:rab GTPase-binding effector protein 1 isoform X2 [Acipenser ruthenus]|uniref:rab GTPase-binding effector protein 1 isoform X2 n=1 Tax=Acipenser ruthenus TaxID=7906 RepID=UPI0027411EC0|nr:rab GTPase-binding effector protein 1 isoform X2 [Acipenser ruthenus]
MAEQPLGSAPPPKLDAGQLHQKAIELEQERAEFQRRKQQLEQEFNQKRAKFKELYLSKEEELKRQGAALESSREEMGRLQGQLAKAQAEMENIKAVATVSESTKQEAIDQVRRQGQEEVASLQAIMKETVRDYELQFHHRLEQERAQWGQYREAVEREMAELRRRLSQGQEEENLENDMKKRRLQVCSARDTESYDKQDTDGSHAGLALLLSSKTFFSDSASQCNYLLWLHTHKYFIEDNKVVLGNVFIEITFLIFGEW